MGAKRPNSLVSYNREQKEKNAVINPTPFGDQILKLDFNTVLPTMHEKCEDDLKP